MKKYRFEGIFEDAEIKIINFFKNNLNFNDRDVEKISIGITVVLFNIFEMSLIFISAFLLGIITQTLLFTVLFVPLRMLAAGVHCKTGQSCMLVTLSLYIGSVLLSTYLPVKPLYALVVGILCIPILSRYAPADTENRPILGKRRRNKLKIETICIVVLILSIVFLSKSTTLSNCAMYAIIIQSISIIPFTYKIFGVNYNNYTLYEP